MTNDLIRIFSDVHYGEHFSRVRTLGQLRPLCQGPHALVINGDMLDTRTGPDPRLTERQRAEVLAFFEENGAPVTFVTGNHDPDFSPRHSLDLAEGQVFAVHGDILFEGIVPWGRDSGHVSRSIREALAALPPGAAERLEDRLLVYRRVAAQVRQRHQSERRLLKYTLRLGFDTVWPPWRVANIFRAWRSLPDRAAALARRHRPRAKFVIVGHTHWPGVWRQADGIVVINTGSFCRPLGAYAVDLLPDRLIVRRVESRHGEFHAGGTVGEFALAKGSG